MKRIGIGGLQSEINVTPLVDVVLVLLIIFMVIVPLTLRGHDVDLPGTADGPSPDQALQTQIVLTVDALTCPLRMPPARDGLPADCRVHLGDEELAAADLAWRAAEIFNPREASERVLFLAADDELNYEGVMRILDAAGAQVTGLRIGIVNRSDAAPPGV